MGAEDRVAITEDLVLDFSGIFKGEASERRGLQENMPQKAEKINVETRLGRGEYKYPTEAQKPVERRLEGQQAKELFWDRKREREDHRRSLDICREYQRNTIESGQLQTDILKGIKAGESVYSLFLKAARAISIMTHDSLFYSQIEADIEAIYGRGLQEKPPLEKELREAQERLQRLLEALEREQSPDSLKLIQRAIEAHKKTIAELESMIARAGEAR